MRQLARDGNGVVSTQVMQEFYQNLIRKLGASPADAADLVRNLRRFEVVLITPELIDDAMALSAVTNLPGSR